MREGERGGDPSLLNMAVLMLSFPLLETLDAIGAPLVAGRSRENAEAVFLYPKDSLAPLLVGVPSPLPPLISFWLFIPPLLLPPGLPFLQLPLPILLVS